MFRSPVRALALVTIAAAGCAGGAAADAPQPDAAASAASSPLAATPAPAAHELKKIAPSANYPLKTCVISGDELGGKMGPPIAYSYDGTEVQFCCGDCIDEFKKDPDKYLAQIRAATK